MVHEWLSQLVDHHAKYHRIDGPAITDLEGRVLSTKVLDETLIEVLEEIYDEDSKQYPMSIQSKDDLHTAYQVFQSLRRSSDTRAIEQNLSRSDTDVVNRWHIFEAAKGSRPNLAMHQHYAQADLLLKPFLRYTKAM
jgi:hypothetical protein